MTDSSRAFPSGRPFQGLDLAPGLCRALPGLEIVDRELVLPGGIPLDLVGVDGDGILALVLFVRGRGAACALACLDALAAARANTAVLARHLGLGGTSAERPARVVLVSKRFSRRALERLAPLVETGVVALEVRRLVSRAGTAVYLTAVAGAGGTANAAVETLAAFYLGLPEERRELARLVVDHIARMDEEIAARAARTSVVWDFCGEPLARLEAVDGRTRGALAGERGTRPIESRTDVEAFLEDVLTHYARLLADAPRDLDEPLGGMDSGPLLTPEEMEAFRQ